MEKLHGLNGNMNKSFYKGKKVFITGHTGFKGSWLCKILLLCGAEVKGYALNPPTNPSIYDLIDLGSQMESVIGDVRDYDKMYEEMKKFSPDIVIHLAAQPIVRESYEKPQYTYDVNVMGTVNVLECIRNLSCVKSALIITTDKVYKNQEWMYGYRECDELCGYDPYSNSKSCAELAYYSYYNCYFKDNKKLSISTSRSGNVIGGGDFAKDRIIPDTVRSYLNNEDIVLRNPNSIRPYQHVLDTLNGYLMLIEKQYKNKEIEGSYNFGPEIESCATTGMLANLFCFKVNDAIKWTTTNENGPHEANFLSLDTTKAKTILNWKDKWDIEYAIEKIVDWTNVYKNNGDLNKEMDDEIKEFLK